MLSLEIAPSGHLSCDPCLKYFSASLAFRKLHILGKNKQYILASGHCGFGVVCPYIFKQNAIPGARESELQREWVRERTRSRETPIQTLSRISSMPELT